MNSAMFSNISKRIVSMRVTPNFILRFSACFTLLVLASCSGAHKTNSQSANLHKDGFLKTGSIVLAQKVPASGPKGAMIGYLPSVPVGKEFSTSGTVSFKRAVPAAKSYSPVVGFFGNKSLKSREYRRSGTISVNRKIPGL